MAIVAAALAFAITPLAHAEDGSLARVVSAKVLRVGVAMNLPWLFKKPDGSWTGYEVNLTTAMARH